LVLPVCPASVPPPASALSACWSDSPPESESESPDESPLPELDADEDELEEPLEPAREVDFRELRATALTVTF